MSRLLALGVVPLLALLASIAGSVSADEPTLPPPPATSDYDNLVTTPDSNTPPPPAEGPTLAPSPDTSAPTAPLSTPPPPEGPAVSAPEPAPAPTEAATKPAEAPAAPEPAPSASPDTAATKPTEAKPEAKKEEPKNEPSPGAATPAVTETPSDLPVAAESPKPEESPQPAPEESPAPEQQAQTTAEEPPVSSLRHHGQIPAFQLTRPQWAVEFTGSPSGLGTSGVSATSDFSGNPTAYEIHFEFQPAFLQSIGVIGFGPTAGLYMFPQDQSIALPTGVWTVGFEGRYQARFFREQPVVPVVGYAIERIAYHLETGSQPAGVVEGDGPIFGLWILLNPFEPLEAEEMFKENGVSRSYLVAEARNLTGGDGNVSFSGNSYFFGLRIEF